jgi:hypothetical protein
LEKNENKDEESLLLINDLKNIRLKENIRQPYNPVFKIIGNIRYQVKSIFEKNRLLGINKNGFAGIGLQLMKINQA